MKRSDSGSSGTLRSGLIILTLVTFASCSGSGSGAGTATGGSGTGGMGSGGKTSTGGSTGSGGGAIGGTGGSTASGGATGTGGSGQSGGAIGTGGAGASAGSRGSGGSAGTGGASGGTGGGSAGRGAAGGAIAGTGGGTAGATGRGGTGGGAAGAGGSQCPATATAMPGNSTKMVMSGGMNRSYVLHVPPGYTGKTPVPVVLDYHGLGGTGMQQMNISNWRAVSDVKGFIVAYPNGIGNSHNMGRCCNPAQQRNIDDVGFARAIISQLKADACIDPKRVYATGCSNGGGMSYKLACDAPDAIAAIAPVDCDCVTGSTVNPSCGMCSPSRPVTEITFRGTGDTIVPYAGGETPVVAGLFFPGAQTNFKDRGEINMCTGTPQALQNRPACKTYPMCGAGTETILCVVQNGSHCGTYGSFDIANVAWETLQKHSLP